MKKIILAIVGIAMLTLAGCGGVQTISGGKADKGEIHFIADKSFDISVHIDNSVYTVKTVKEKSYRRDRNLSKTAQNAISLTPGQHKVIVFDMNGNQIYEHLVFISANEHKVIRL